ncbi:chorion class B protein M3A5-like [Colias croceus]|uniref:chorion class B protein M3A5-like n=1 Tax=Colias crocea TaxID=72248 RepID=UPI001E27F1EB|nr:chorion class B protein M3A5-like [Colias croceus]
MVSKTVFIFCAQALFIQCITAYVCEPKVYEEPCTRSLAFNPASLAASNGGSFTITSSSPISPTGVTMKSDNAYEGPVNVGGEIPFLGAVEVDGALPTAGAGGISYGCGNGNVAILSENLNGNRVGYGAGYGLGYGTGYGYGPVYKGCA